jgi:Tol biopolymer transport system component
LGIRAIGIGLAVLWVSASPADAQYFGPNKVQYETFDFQVLRTEHFDVHYYAAEQEAALAAAAMAERWYVRLSRALDHTLSERTPIVLYASPPHFRQTTVLPGTLPEGVGGFTDHQKGRVVLPFAPALGETDHVLGHELVHAFQRDILQQAGRSMTLPLWFMEGMAEFLTLGGVDPSTSMWIRDAVDGNRLPPIRELQDPKWFPYRFGQALWAFLADEFGEDIAGRALAAKAKGGAVGRIVRTTGVRESQLTARWHEAMRNLAAGVAAPTAPAAELLVGERHGGGRLNVGPALSPDGEHMVFLSERDRYSIDVFLADGRTGRVRRKLVATAGNPRFDSLQFVDSAGAWDHAGQRFAFAALQHGEPLLTILSMPDGNIAREDTFPALDQIFDPTWSPAGDRIAFSGLSGGVTDLYVFDLETAALRRLTTDGFADLQPSWSPDGRTLAFTTDRFTSSLEALTFGDYRLAALDLESGALRELPSIVGAKNIDPQWIGQDLLFIADADGVSNVFRLDVAAGSVHRLTNERTGVSGITFLSPALSIAPLAGRIAYNAYRNGGYEIRTMAIPAGLAYANELSDPAGPLVTTGTAPASLATAAPSFPTARYRGGLSLSGIGQPYLSAGGGALGTFFRAGMSVSFGDLLEQRQLQTAVQVGTRANDFAVQTAYVNRSSRWTWGVLGAQLPVNFVSARTYAGAASTIEQETETFRQTHRQGMLLTAYPFSRARRVELTAGVHTIGFASDLRIRSYARSNGSLIAERDETGNAPSGVTLFETAAALVYDSSVSGPTAPVLGSRSRFEIAPTFGDLSLITFTADYRRYLMPVRPLTVALRVQHVGRYGADASDGRLLPLVWTVRDLVRGHSLREAIGRSCASSGCQLLADAGARRATVGNMELRIPFVGPLGVVRESGPLPIDAFLFADIGWFASGASGALHDTLLRSAGGGARLNATGFVFEFAAARAQRGWTMVVNFRPGF